MAYRLQPNAILLLGASLVLVVFGGCVTHSTTPSEVASSTQLEQFLEAVFEARLARSPELQTRLGIKTDYGAWDSRTELAARRALETEREFLDEMRQQFSFERLSAADQLNYRLYEFDVELREARYPWRHHSYALDHRYGMHTNAPSFLINSHRIDTVEDAEAYIARVHGLKPLFEQIAGQLRMAAGKGVVPPQLVFDPAIAAAKNVISGAPFSAGTPDSALRADFKSKLDARDLDNRTQTRLLASLDAALIESAQPAYLGLINTLSLLKARAGGDRGVWALPDGDEYYALTLRRHTTTQLGADEIHDIGLREVARIHNEMRQIMGVVGFAGDLQAFFEFTRVDPQFFYSNDATGRARYLAEARAYIDAMRERLPELFSVFPKGQLIVKRVETFREQSAGRAFYGRPSADDSKPGIYYANLYQMNRMPVYQMQALAYHEGIPGHHMQIAIQQELERLPRFRRFGRITAFSEGWGLYSEWLPTQIGAYEDPYSDFGRLAMELWRACRLVVDTGIHARQWTRDEGIRYLLENSPNPEGDAINAIDRYLVNPGQATAYMMGKLTIMKLRQQAEAALGDRFDVRRFHDAVLANGPLPLAVLEQQIDLYINQQLTSN